MANPQSSVASVHHLHAVGEVCPTCDQPIPHDRAEEIARRLEARDTERSAEIIRGLEEKFATERVEADERNRLHTEQQVADARTQTANAAQAQIQAATEAQDAAEAALRQKDEAITAERATAEENRLALVQQVADAQSAAMAEVERMKAEAAAREEEVRIQATAAADAKAAERFTALEAERGAAQEAARSAEAKLETTQADHAIALTALEEKATEREAAARREVAAQAQTTVDEAQAAKAEAERQAAEATSALTTAQTTHKAELESRLTEQREVFEIEKMAAVNAEKVTNFEANLKLSNRVEELQRLVDKQASDELGEGAEVKLYDALLAEFDGDKITRVGRGNSGADIIHVVMHNGRECGTIIYDSKDHGAWRNEFVTKLRADQLAAKAEHAILSSRKFPAGARQLHNQDGVLIANPARVVALVSLLRSHLVQTHSLRLSGEERTQKTAALYDFITSERCRDLLGRFDIHANDLEDLQVKEKKAHDANWRKQGEIFRSIGRVKAEISAEIDAIIGGGSSGGQS